MIASFARSVYSIGKLRIEQLRDGKLKIVQRHIGYCVSQIDVVYNNHLLVIARGGEISE